jgi:acyl-CoA thioesterase I
LKNVANSYAVWGLALVAVASVLSIFIWAWAMRRPAPVEGPEIVQQPTPTEPRPLVYAAIGASDVVGVGADNPSTQSWINVLHNRMPEGTRLVRLGRGGITLREANQVEVPAAVKAQPDIVTMWNAVNDATRGITLTTYLQDLNSALTRLTQETDARIVLLNLPDITVLMQGVPAPQLSAIRGGIVQWNSSMAQTAAKYNGRVHIVDLFPISEEILNHPEYISSDNFHPSTVGYTRLADIVWDEIQRDRLLER